MTSIKELLLLCQKKLGGASQAQTMKHLGMHRQAWTQIDEGSGVNDKNALRIAEFLDIDRMYVISAARYAGASDKEVKRFWKSVHKSCEGKKRSEDCINIQMAR